MDDRQPPEIQIILTGDATAPRQVGLGQLAGMLDATDRLVQQSVQDVFDTQASATLYLSRFQEGSIVLVCRPTPSATVDPIHALTSVMRQVKAGQFERMSFDLCACLRAFFKETTKHAQFVTFRSRDQRQISLPTATAIPEPLAIEEATTIYGLLLRLGGKRPIATLQTSRQEVRCNVTEEQARELGMYLYQEIGVTGVATWNVGTMKIEQFDVQAIIAPRQYQTWEEALPRLHEAFGKYFADIPDSVAWVRSLRDDDSEDAACHWCTDHCSG